MPILNPSKSGRSISSSRLILFSFRYISNFRLQRYMAQRLVDRGYSVVLVYEGGEDDVVSAAREEAGTLATSIISSGTHVASLSHVQSTNFRGRRSVRQFLMAVYASVIRSNTTSAHISAIKLSLTRATVFIEELRPAALIVNEDGISSDIPLIAAAKSLGVPVLDVPYAFAAQGEFDIVLEQKAQVGELKIAGGIDGYALKLLAPQWIKTGKFPGALIFGDKVTIAYEALGVSLSNPWNAHGGPSDKLLAEGEINFRRYKEDGIPSKKIVVTGSPYCDEMIESLANDPLARSALRRPQLIAPPSRRLLVSWPANYHTMRAAFSEFRTYEEMTLSVLSFLRDLPGCELTVSLHPAATEQTRRMLVEAGIRVSNEYIIRLVAKHDIFVSYFSSVARWAIAAGKPVVNYDAYRQNTKIYDGLAEFVNTPSLNEFKSAITNLVESEEAFRKAASRQCAMAANWGLIDGKCMDRIVVEIEKLISKNER